MDTAILFYKEFGEITKLINKKQALNIRNLKYSFLSMFLDYLENKTDYSYLMLSDSVERAEQLLIEQDSLGGNKHQILLPGENYPYCKSDIDDERKGSRLVSLNDLYSSSQLEKKCIISTYRNLFEILPSKKEFKKNKIILRVGQILDVNNLKEDLIHNKFINATLVENIGEFSIKGSIIDIFPYGAEYPLRIELFDTEIDSLRIFNPADQKKIKNIQNFEIFFGDINNFEILDNKETFNLLSLFTNPKTVIIVENCDNIQLKLSSYFNKEIKTGYDRIEDEKKKSVDEKYFNVADIISILSTKKVIYGRNTHDNLDYQISLLEHPSFKYDFKNFISSLYNNNKVGYKTYLCCDNKGQADRFSDIIRENELSSKNIKIVIKDLFEGFILPDSKIAVYTDHQIFGRIKRLKRQQKYKKSLPIRELTKLFYGDYLVHTDHGIGRYLGTEKIEVGGIEREVLKIIYRDNDILFLNIEKIGLVKKYKSSEDSFPKLSKLGSDEFKKLRIRTKNSIKSIARELISIYARRKKAKGQACKEDSLWQIEMEQSFEFTTTDDQQRAINEVKYDLESSMAMDRLVCGDVGFGKTEVAIRAAFKVANSGRQVAFLAPTTILVSQHYENIKRRLEKYPIRIEVLSRFKTAKDQSLIVSDIAKGKIDIIVATHRLLSKDIKFSKLGLLIVDEEQRFGVKHKEKLKQLKINIDVLTLTATPIPRTLHMSLMGVRDLSIINTPPVNRLPIKTEIHQHSDSVIFEAVMKEIDRGGQVFYLHNRVETINNIKPYLEKLLPDINIGIAHGQMKASVLEKVIMDFMQKKYDLLITTTIIENGVDIPNVNTLIVERADKFGISQLYQIRGRIGRSHRQAYAYLLIPRDQVISELSKKRLDTISEHTDLGSGMQIAMKDLEIRGAGNLLGKEQSGHVEKIGFDLYTKILTEAVQELKKDEFSDVMSELPDPPTYGKTEVNIPGKYFIPETYIGEDSERVDIYRRMMECTDIHQLDIIYLEMRDRYGVIVPEVDNLFTMIKISIAASRYLLKSVNVVRSQKKYSIRLVFDYDLMNNKENLHISNSIHDKIISLTQLKEFSVQLESGGRIVNIMNFSSMSYNETIFKILDYFSTSN